jgi:transcriptional regulator of aromatic amino acid metabolism
VQAKLLTALESRTVRRLGGVREDPVDVWVVAATSENLQVAIAERRFREDLFHRLAVVVLSLPPRRERRVDIVPLADRFLTQACSDYAAASAHTGARRDFAARVGRNRERVGFHYQSDTEAGVSLAERMFPLLAGGSDYLKTFAAAQGEW